MEHSDMEKGPADLHGKELEEEPVDLLDVSERHAVTDDADEEEEEEEEVHELEEAVGKVVAREEKEPARTGYYNSPGYTSQFMIPNNRKRQFKNNFDAHPSCRCYNNFNKAPVKKHNCVISQSHITF